MSTISASTTTTTGYVVTADTTGTLVLQTGASPTTAVTIDTSQNVGIGTSSPNARLHVNNGSGGGASSYFTDSTTGTSSGFQVGLDSGHNAILNMQYNAQMLFSTNNAERMRIDSNGNLLVGATGTSFPSADAKVVSLTNAVQNALFVNVNAASSTAKSAIAVRKYDNNNTTSQIYLDFQYNQGTSGAGGIQGNGASGAQFYSSSDARLKENIVELEPQLANILALKPSKFDYIDGPKDCTGFIAQEMEQVYADVVGETPDGYKTIGGISIMETRIIKAIQELKAELDAAKADIATLKGAA